MNVPTAEDFLKEVYKQNKGGLEEWVDYEDALQKLKAFARLHVETARQAYVDSLRKNDYLLHPGYIDEFDQEFQKAYPLSNIQ
jgi:hypothetical protein